MSHKAQQDFCARAKAKYPDHFKNGRVLDIGSGDINGNNRYLFDGCDYVGVDVTQGKNVDYIGFAHEVPFINGSFNTVISTECFEHDMFWTASLRKMYQLLRVGGLMVFSCASEGRPEHGTSRTSAHASLTVKLGIEYYRNLVPADIDLVLNTPVNFTDPEFGKSLPGALQDMYFMGIKKSEKLY